MRLRTWLFLLLAAGWCVAGVGPGAPHAVSVPNDRLEMVTGHVSAVKPGARRQAVIRLLGRAGDSYSLRSAGVAYDLKVSFTVTSGGQTQYDGAWTMEDIFVPGQGLRWTAKGPDGYSITRIATHGMLYGEDTASYVPLRLHEARAALFDPMPELTNFRRGEIRSATAVRNGTELTCVLMSNRREHAPVSAGRRWDET